MKERGGEVQNLKGTKVIKKGMKSAMKEKNVVERERKMLRKERRRELTKEIGGV
jgi:hypothetical protein